MKLVKISINGIWWTVFAWIIFVWRSTCVQYSGCYWFTAILCSLLPRGILSSHILIGGYHQSLQELDAINMLHFVSVTTRKQSLLGTRLAHILVMIYFTTMGLLHNVWASQPNKLILEAPKPSKQTRPYCASDYITREVRARPSDATCGRNPNWYRLHATSPRNGRRLLI